MASYPYTLKTVAMDDTVKSVKLEGVWNSVVLKMRETDVDFLIYDEAGTKYFTVPQGSSFALSSYNMSGGNSSDFVKVKAASGTLEIIGFIRE